MSDPNWIKALKVIAVSAAYVSAVVAAAAVIVSGVLQYLTLRRSREEAAETLAATERTARIAALSGATTIWEQGLREDLAEFATLSYEVESAYKAAMDSGSPWPGENAEKVSGTETIFHRIRMRLDQSVPSQRALIESLEALRDDDERLWVNRRDETVEAAVEAIRSRWADNLYGEAVPRSSP
jgi:hypothetical protein